MDLLTVALLLGVTSSHIPLALPFCLAVMILWFLLQLFCWTLCPTEPTSARSHISVPISIANWPCFSCDRSTYRPTEKQMPDGALISCCATEHPLSLLFWYRSLLKISIWQGLNVGGYYTVSETAEAPINISLQRVSHLLFVVVAKFGCLNFKGFVCMVYSISENDKNS